MKKDIILQVKNLSKSYGTLKAVDDISFEVRRGEFFCFLGPNGAGKSTTIKIITTLLMKDKGEYSLNGSSDDVYIRSKIGVVFQDNTSDDFLTVKENIFYLGSLYLADKAALTAKYEELKKTLDLGEIENKRFKFLSGGQKRRVEIAKALVGSPEILFLDEPTTGLDPESRKVIWSIIQNLQKQRNLTVFLTTHYMHETDDSDYVVILNKGKICAQGTPSELKSEYASDILKIKAKDAQKLKDYLQNVKFEGNEVADTVIIKNLSVEQNIALLQDNKGNIESFEVIKGTMDDVFISVVEGN
jgi:multidrug/hemolysin transport system ATP-binding protein